MTDRTNRFVDPLFVLPTHQRLVKRGITLVELMIAVAISIVILGVMLFVFSRSSDQISKARATLEMASQMRSAGETLRSDLENVTVPLRPWAIDTQANGYFEYIEGPDTDRLENVAGVSVELADMANTTVAGASYLGDHDDILAMTVRSRTRPFRGRWVNPVTGLTETIESYVAEIIWWTIHNDIDGDTDVDYAENISLYRRVLLVRPDLTTNYASADMDLFFADNDISGRPDSSGTVAFNSLDDLTKRENRFSHNSAVFPHAMQRAWLNDRALGDNSRGIGTDAQGSDVMLTNVAAFDVKIFSPNTDVAEAADQIIDPDDRGYATVTGPFSPDGAFVDLGNGQNSTGDAWFRGVPNVNSQLDTVPIGNTWCTWSAHYEYDGVNQDSGDDSIVDQGTDGLDNDNANGADDDLERETKPPYEWPIRGLQISFRLIEKNSAQSRQLTVRQSFVPE